MTNDEPNSIHPNRDERLSATAKDFLQIMRHDLDFNEGWQFRLGEDAEWRGVRLPHDWSVEHAFTQEQAGGGTAWLPGGIGWYRKTFQMPLDAQDRITWIEFDGVYNNAEVWLNGHLLGERPYGYVPFSFDLTSLLHYGGETNVLEVKVDRSAYLDCRWYPGSGIYRNVRLVTVGGTHIPQWGVAVSTPVATAARAEVLVKTTVCNREDAAVTVSVRAAIDGDQETVSSGVVLEPGDTREVEQQIRLTDPELWGPDSPHLYRLNVSLEGESGALDAMTTPFGIRELRFDKDQGFFLNGKHTLLKGVCLHHDAGCVGAAVPIEVWERRFRLLKELGCNAIRTAHNPPSEEVLDLCDRMGFLVQDEAFDEWDHPKDKRHNFNQQKADDVTEGYTRFFSDWCEEDIEAMVRRDRNHPSVIMWSLGNEIEWTYPRYGKATGYWDEGDGAPYYVVEPPNDDTTMRKVFEESYEGGPILVETAARLAARVKEIDLTRPVTANMVIPSVGLFSGFVDVQDILGFSYRQCVYDYCRTRSAEKMVLGAENWAQWSEWKPVLEKPYLAGIFLWTGIDYLGEAREWPAKASNSGLIDLAGFPKPKYHYFRSLWCEDLMVHLTATPLRDSNYILQEDGTLIEDPARPRDWQWGWPALEEHWNFAEGGLVYVEAYSNCSEVELFLNDRSLGVRRPADSEDRVLRWAVRYEPGCLRAVGDQGTSAERATAGGAQAVSLELDRSSVRAGSRDVVHCVAQLIDGDGKPVRHQEKAIRFHVEGDARILGVDNGAYNSVQTYQSDTCQTHQGRCLLILQAGIESGPIEIRAASEELKAGIQRIDQLNSEKDCGV